MFSALRKLIAARPKPMASDECVFSLDPQKRKLMLLDLKIVLRLPGSRLALPNVANLETTVRRNHERIRIPYAAMLVLVRELIGVRHRIAPTSPLREIMTAIPGLANPEVLEAKPASPQVAGHTLSIRMPGLPSAEQDAEVLRIRKLIAQKPVLPVPPERVQPRPAARKTRKATASPRQDRAIHREDGNDDGEQAVDAIALSTGELTDEDFAGYVDLCILNGDHAQVVEMLLERTDERPGAWVWVRLLELLEAMDDPRFATTRETFHAWVVRHCPELLPREGDGCETVYGVVRDALHEREREEIGPHAMR